MVVVSFSLITATPIDLSQLLYYNCFKQYRVHYNFRGGSILQICYFQRFHNFKLADAGASSVETFTGETLVDVQMCLCTSAPGYLGLLIR